MKRFLNRFLFFMLISTGGMSIIYAQALDVSGVVTDGDGVPIPGVNITIEDTDLGTNTDFDGNYSLSAESGQVIRFSSIGFQDVTVTVGASSEINVTLEEGTSLDEVVVTALGISREKRSLGYATQEVKSDALNRGKQGDVANALSGKVAGVQIRRNTSLGGGTNVIIRGNTSLTGDNQALWVIDGVPVDNSNYSSSNDNVDYGNAVADLNPDDIESINVLKGAAATALYGSRAANGAIIVTTKTGKERNGLGITISSSVSIGSIDRETFPQWQDEYGGGYGPVNGPNGDSYFNWEDIDGDGNLDRVAPFTEYGGWGAPYDPDLLVYQWNSVYPESPDYNTATPWVKPDNGPLELFNKSPITLNNNISFSGNSENSTYRLNYSNYSQEGIIPKSKLDRHNFSLNSSFKLSDKLEISGSANYSKTTTQGRLRGGIGGPYTNIFINLRQYYQPNIDFKKLKDLYNATGENLSQFPGGTIDNSFYIYDEDKEEDTRNRFIGNASLKYELTDWLDFTGRISVDTYNFEIDERRNAIIREPAFYSLRNIFFEELNYDLMLNYNKDFGDDFNLSGVVGSNIRRNKFKSSYNETNGGLIVDGLYAISNSVGTPPAAEETVRERGVNSIYGLVSFGYKNMLFVDATGRNDWSSTLPKGNNSFFYPSITTSFIFSNLIESSALSFGKLRLNYAEVGNSAEPQSLVDVLTKPEPFGSTQLYSVNSTKNNPDLKPESTVSYEAGLELSFFSGRVGLDLSAYKTNTKDQIMPIVISSATGYSRKYVNSGEVENKGVELSLSGTPVKTDDFQWDMTLNWSANSSKILSLAEGVDNLQLYATGSHNVTINAEVGGPYGVFYGSDFIYKEGKKVVDQNTGFYQKTSTSDQVIGRMLPNWTGSVNNTFRYKDVSLSFLIDVRKGGQIFSSDMAVGSRNGLYSNTTGTNELGNPVRSPVEDGGGLILDGVAPDGSPNTVRSSFMDRDHALGHPTAPDAMFMYDASYVKLRELALSYNFPSEIIEKLSLTGLELSVIGSNLWIIHKNVPYADPEGGMTSGNIQGHHQGVYPSLREFGFNVKLQF